MKKFVASFLLFQLVGGVAMGKALELPDHGDFSILPPITNADPSKRSPRTLQLPSRLLISRTDDQIAVQVDTSSLKPVTLKVGDHMVTGLAYELSVYRGGKLVISGQGGLSSDNDATGIGTMYLNRHLDGIPKTGESYVVKMKVTLFETDIPPQHEWSPKSGKYKVLLIREIL